MVATSSLTLDSSCVPSYLRGIVVLLAHAYFLFLFSFFAVAVGINCYWWSCGRSCIAFTRADTLPSFCTKWKCCAPKYSLNLRCGFSMLPTMRDVPKDPYFRGWFSSIVFSRSCFHAFPFRFIVICCCGEAVSVAASTNPHVSGCST